MYVHTLIELFTILIESNKLKCKYLKENKI